jgi:hypothetical protein
VHAQRHEHPFQLSLAAAPLHNSQEVLHPKATLEYTVDRVTAAAGCDEAPEKAAVRCAHPRRLWTSTL